MDAPSKSPSKRPKSPVGWRSLHDRFLRQSAHEEFAQSLIPTAILIGVVLVWLLFYPEKIQEIDTFKALTQLSNIVISVFPSLTGISLAGYTIVIGCINPSVLKRICKKKTEVRNSLFQDLNVTFAVSLALSIGVLAVAFFTNVICSYELEVPNNMANVINCVIGIVLIYFSFAAFRSFLSIVINVFNFGEFINFLTNKEIERETNAKTN